MTRIKTLVHTVAVGAFVVGAAMLPATAAQAAPTGCTESYVATTQYKAKCNTPYPYGTFYVRLVCHHVSSGASQVKFGHVATTNSGTYSSATCSSGYESTVGTVEH